jgi:hypothetical protein
MKTLNDFFDHIYCLNLIHRTDKWNKMCDEFKKHDIVEVQRLGVWGKKAFQSGWNIHAASYGVVMSNFLALLDAMEKGYQRVLILDDDVHFEENLNEKFWEKIEYLPTDWHLLYLGGNSQFTWGNFEMVTGDKTIKITKENYKTFNNELVKTRWTQCAPAVGYNGNIIPDLLERLKAWKQPYDVLLPTLAKNNIYNSYIFLPTLAKPIAGVNDANGVYVDYVNSEINNF